MATTWSLPYQHNEFTNNNGKCVLTTLEQYAKPYNLRIFCLGISSGFPWVLIGSMLTLWLKDAGLTRSAIGYAGAIFAVYSINFLWAPLVDRVKLPFIHRIGQRRSWIITTQLCIGLCCLIMVTSNPAYNASLTVLYCLFIAIFSATQDIAIDAYRIDSLPEDQPDLQATGAAMATAGWWTGYAGIGFIPLWLSDNTSLHWAIIYVFMALVPLCLLIVTLLSPEPKAVSRQAQQKQTETYYLRAMPSIALRRKLSLALSLLLPILLTAWAFTGFAGLPHFNWAPVAIVTALMLLIGIAWQLAYLDKTIANTSSANTHYLLLDKSLAWLLVTLAQPIKEFFSRTGTKAAISILVFIFLFKIGEAFLGRMSIVFYKELGFSNTDIGFYSKLISWWVTIVFSIIGGWFTLKQGIFKGLLIGGIAMAASNLMFAVMATVGPNKALFAVTVLVDGFTTSWSTVAFVAFISLLCSRTFTATQYALLASLGTLGRTLLASTSGQLVDGLNGNWQLFFSLTAFMVIPALALLLWAKDDIQALKKS